MATIWCAALGQSAVAAVFGIFGTFWLSYAVLVVALDHNCFAITPTAILDTVKLFLVSWLFAIVMLTLATLRLPSAFSVLFGLVDLALLLLLLGYANPPRWTRSWPSSTASPTRSGSGWAARPENRAGPPFSRGAGPLVTRYIVM